MILPQLTVYADAYSILRNDTTCKRATSAGALKYFEPSFFGLKKGAKRAQSIVGNEMQTRS